jgi:hypothetical protein
MRRVDAEPETAASFSNVVDVQIIGDGSDKNAVGDPMGIVVAALAVARWEGGPDPQPTVTDDLDPAVDQIASSQLLGQLGHSVLEDAEVMDEAVTLGLVPAVAACDSAAHDTNRQSWLRSQQEQIAGPSLILDQLAPVQAW